MAKKTIKVLQALSYIDNLDLDYDELDRLIEEMGMLLISKDEEDENT